MSLFNDIITRTKFENDARLDMIKANAENIRRLEQIVQWINSSGYSATADLNVHCLNGKATSIGYSIDLTASKERLSDLLIAMERCAIEASRCSDQCYSREVWDLKAYGEMPITLWRRDPIHLKQAAHTGRRVA